MNIKHYLMLVIGYFVGRHYGRQQGSSRRAPYISYPRRMFKQTVFERMNDILIMKINKFFYGEEKILPARYSAAPYRPPRPVPMERDEELEKLLDEEEEFRAEQESDHSGNYGPNGI